MEVVVNSLFPVIALIFAGMFLRRMGVLSEKFWPSAEKLTYYVLYPALLIKNLAERDLSALPLQEIFITVEATVLAAALVITLWWLVNRKVDGTLFTSIFQGGVRFNFYVALALVQALFGADGMFICIVAASFMIVLINFLCVTAFALAVPDADGTGFNFTRFAKTLVTNPLLMGCVIGGLLNVAGIALTTPISNTLGLIGRAAVPLGLMAVGAATRSLPSRAQLTPLLVSSVVQFAFKPLVALSLILLTGIGGITASVILILFTIPTASSAYILSRQLGGDHETMATIVTFQTLLSFATLPFVIAYIA
jgi:hypothetical protein